MGDDINQSAKNSPRFAHDWPVKTYFHWHEADKTFTIESVQDVEPILEINKRRFNNAPRHTFGQDLRSMGEIPVLFIEVYKKSTGIDLLKVEDKIIRKFFQKPDHSLLRTRPVKTEY